MSVKSASTQSLLLGLVLAVGGVGDGWAEHAP